ncbi:hypothetical protein [Phycicoccus endophyticus]|uniref:hypothetical protein n=1 Tax=Phycicoccus endophyticus TaxID=1690220 RepID=UPI00403AAB95
MHARSVHATGGTRVAFESVQLTAAHPDWLDTAIAAMAADSEYTDTTRRLTCLCGVSTLTGFALAAEIGDWRRLDGATIRAYVGLVPTETLQRRQTHAGRHHQDPEQPRPTAAGRSRADAGDRRLNHRWVQLETRR